MTKFNFTIPKDYYNAKKVDRDLSRPFIKDFFIVCDVGGASGVDTFPIAKLAYFTINLDVNLSALKIGKKRADETGISNKLSFICASATDLPIRSKILDMITCFSVIDHLPGKKSAQRAISEFSRVVRRKGYTSITVPNMLFLLGTLSMRIKQYIDNDAYFEQRFTPKELNYMIKSVGLTPIYFDSRYPTIIGNHLLKYNFPKIIRKVPIKLLYPFMQLWEKIFGILQSVSWLKLCGARIGYLSINNQ